MSQARPAAGEDGVVDDDPNAYLDAVLIGGRESASIVVVDYDYAGPARFGALSDPKPLIDTLLIVDDVDDEAAFVPPLEAAGSELRVREPDHRMFRTPQHDMHLHVYAAGRTEERDYLDVRYWLRVSSRDRILYANAKHHLAQKRWNDMNDYVDAKADVVLDILSRARTWRAASARPTEA